jgi:hypothetical protein
MFRTLVTIIFIAAIPCLGMSCASYKVTKNPDDCNTGIRYYRPKPYLYVGPARNFSTAGAPMVSIAVEYLPDYEEEYAIEINPGLGTTDTTVTLDNGWNLTSFAGKTDQKYAEILQSLSSMVTAAGGLARSNMAPAAPRDPGDVATPIDVPYGYYESVFWYDNCGKKHLYGWRYVGMILSGCPVQACPALHDCYCDDPDEFWALIPGGSGLQFVRIADLKSGKIKRSMMQSQDAPAPPPPADAPAAKPSALRYDEGDGDLEAPTKTSKARSHGRPATARGEGSSIAER